MAVSTIPGFPRIGRNRELKWAEERYWSGKGSVEDLMTVADDVRVANWASQRAAGLDLIPVDDFSLYDQTLDAAVLVGAIPARYGAGEIELDDYFAMARGRTGANGVRAMEMTKWFDTNYHYLVPEFAAGQSFKLASNKPFAEFAEAQAAGFWAKPVLLGPISLLLLGKTETHASPLALLPKLLPVYAEAIEKLSAAGAEWIQIDEPMLVTDLADEALAKIPSAYARLAEAKGAAKLLLQTYFGTVGDAYEMVAALPVDGIGLDFVRGADQVELIEKHGFPTDKTLAAGVIDGRNVWINDLSASLALLKRLESATASDRLMVSTSCSLLHVPYDLRLEVDLDERIRPWLAFAEQKLAEVVVLTKGVNEGGAAIARELAANRGALADAAASRLRHDPRVKERLASLPAGADRRAKPFAERAEDQAKRLNLPPLPTTTIGSFPQTPDLRAARRKFEAGELDAEGYDEVIKESIRETVAEQELLGLDVLVHGEPERNDMVQYFGEQLAGFAFTRHGWVQSYGSRCVRPPIIYGDVSRPKPMTVDWARFAQSLTDRPMKGMLTGPVTILNWSFVRDDQPRSETCRQIALAIRDEVADLDAAGIAVIQIDEPALREGLPLRHRDRAAYLDWAVQCFRLAAGGARPETQIHTHMCYSEFGDVIDAISALDADVISIENARSDLELLDVFRSHGYDKGIGPGVYDIHSPRVPPADEMAENLRATLTVLNPGQVWVNPDCGLKTRKPGEARAALRNMVEAAREVRAEATASA
jgi:5-methyltetrahydropteroyltriglutamate--homocysteine methyltransferase